MEQNIKSQNLCDVDKLVTSTGFDPVSLGVRSSPSQYKWICQYCNRCFKSRRLLSKHKAEDHELIRKGHCYEQNCECYCQYCNNKFIRKSARTKHEKYCKLNPNHIEGKNTGLTEAGREKLREIGKKSVALNNFWEFRSKNPILYVMKTGEKIKLDSKLEEETAKFLDSHNINWYKPKCSLDWYDYDNKKHAFHPDFYLTEFNCFIECKSEYIEHVQNKQGKIDYIKEHYNFIKWVHNINDLDNLIIDCSRCNFIPEKYHITDKILNFVEKHKNIKKHSLQEYWDNKLKDEWLYRKNLIENSNIDLMQFGWVTKVINKTGLTKRIIENTVKKFNIPCFKRKN